MKRYEFYNHSDGSRVRVPAGSIGGPASLIREVYRMHRRDIHNSIDLRATLRAGKYTSLGCYPVFLITSDCCALCMDCARAEYRNVSRAIREKFNDGWRVTNCEVNYEDKELYCDHCSQPIESAYGDD
jgi:hypothetical protein